MKEKLAANTTAKSTAARQKSPCLAAIFYLLDLSQTTEVCLYKMDKSTDLVPQVSHVQIGKFKEFFFYWKWSGSSEWKALLTHCLWNAQQTCSPGNYLQTFLFNLTAELALRVCFSSSANLSTQSKRGAPTPLPLKRRWRLKPGWASSHLHLRRYQMQNCKT